MWQMAKTGFLKMKCEIVPENSYRIISSLSHAPFHNRKSYRYIACQKCWEREVWKQKEGTKQARHLLANTVILTNTMASFSHCKTTQVYLYVFSLSRLCETVIFATKPSPKSTNTNQIDPNPGPYEVPHIYVYGMAAMLGYLRQPGQPCCHAEPKHQQWL